MCGFVATTDINNVQRMLERQEHRGPDGNYYMRSADVAIGHSLLDISGAQQHQPIVTKKGNLFAFNGEAYDSNIENDTVFMANGFEMFGLRFLSQTDWHGSIVYYDKTTREITAIRDHFGAKPLWMYKRGEEITFSTSMKSFTHKEFNPHEEQGYKGIKQWMQNKSPYKHIIKLNPGEIVKYNFRTKTLATKKNLWDIWKMQSWYKTVPEDFPERLIKSIQKLAKNKHKTGLFLSGGLDSTMVLAAVKDMGLDLEVFTAAYSDDKTEFDLDDMRNESNMAIKTCKEWGIPINVVKLDIRDREHYGKLWMNYTNFAWSDHNRRAPRFMLCKAAAEKGCKVILTGDSADEMFGGYIHHDKRLSPEYCKQMLDGFKDKVPNVFGDDLINNTLYCDLMSTSEQNILATDQTCGMFGMESRPVYCAQNFVKYTFSIAGKYKVWQDKDFLEKSKNWAGKTTPGIYKYLLRHTMRDYLPKHVLERTNKIGWTSPWQNNLRHIQDRWIEQDIEHMKLMNK